MLFTGAAALSAPHSAPMPAGAASPVEPVAANAAATVVDAREALRRRDRARLAADRATAASDRNPLAMWVDYWELSSRLNDAQPDEVNAFIGKWTGTYVEDRLRNDWLLELGRRRDFDRIAVEFPRFRMNDDREVSCYAWMNDHAAGKPVHDAALDAWLLQRDPDDGCALLASTLYADKVFSAADVWRKARAAADANKPKSARQAVALLGVGHAVAISPIFDSPARYLTRTASASNRINAELTTLALMRLATTDADNTATQLNDRWERALPKELAAWAWAFLARTNASNLRPEAADQYLRAERVNPKDGKELALTDDMLAWKVRSALRADNGRPRWQQVVQAINAMSVTEQKNDSWVYWKARGLQALAKDSQDGESLRALSRDLLGTIAAQPTFYGNLAADDLGKPFVWPPKPPITLDERDAVLARPGLVRGLQLISIGLRNEGVREWNYTLRGMSDRELIAAAQFACDNEVWDRCINTSERTRAEVDIEQRFPLPHRREIASQSREVGIDPAYVYGVIRQESRFMMDARSGVGASGLMQLMPATAKWTAKRAGVPYSVQQITDRDTNLKLGATYLKFVLDDVNGSQAMAAAAYNAGPGRPRRWREGPTLEPAAWIENIPFPETRDYVKKVVVNTGTYAVLLGGKPLPLRARLGKTIGPLDPNAPVDRELP